MSTNTDELFDGLGFVIGLNTAGAVGAANSTIAGLVDGGGSGAGGALDSSDGAVLGIKDAGDADAGITIPTLTPEVREAAQVSGSFTQSYDPFIKAVMEGFQITIPFMGNGATATPSNDDAKPYAGIDVLWQIAGLSGATGTAPEYVYTPRASAFYATAKIFFGDLAYVLNDVTCESTSIVLTAGGKANVVFDMKVGLYDPTTDFSESLTFPTFIYDNQATLAEPTVEGIAFDWGETHGFEGDFTINIANSLETFGDSNVATTGQRDFQKDRVITASGTIYVEATDTQFHHAQAISLVAQTEDMTFQLGTAAGAADTVNAFAVSVNNLQPGSVKYNRIGTALVVEVSAKATGLTAGSEFTLTAN